MKSLLLLSFAIPMACGVEPAPRTETAQGEAVSSALSSTPTGDDADAITPALSCFDSWDCRSCGPLGRTQNILVRFCDDGSETIVGKGACGQPCF
jgi:hypothetical protein